MKEADERGAMTRRDERVMRIAIRSGNATPAPQERMMPIARLIG